ncbi:MAG: transglutaminase-like domain-containing protein [Planctomycetes bacterium]|nr:transglutaminase-like domain-containing protein [Planctomycetota bacterium]
MIPIVSQRFLGACVAMLLAMTGCVETQSPPAPASPAASANPSPRPRSQSAESPNVAESTLPAGETWTVHYLQDVKVGHGRMKVVPQESGLVKIVSKDELTLSRGGSTVTQRITATSVEKPAGELVRFESRMNLGPTATVSRGEVTSAGGLHVETETAGKTVSQTLPWRPEWRGFFAVDQSLHRSPMQPGETRTLRALQPVLNQVGEVRMTARDYEETPLLLGTRRLLRIDAAVALADFPFEMTLWTDKEGRTWKTFTPQLKQTSYRATEELALSENEAANYDLFADITVPIQTPLTDGHDTRRVVYRAKLQNGDPAEAFVSGASQAVRSIDEHTAEITVRAVRPGQPADPGEVTPPTDEDLAANSLIQSDDPQVIDLAKNVAREERDPWKIAVTLERFVKGAITEKNFSQAFATAAEVAETREGDCTEHAVLLAALCRARGIPARGAMGLVYFPQANRAGFAYHMWTEVWIEDRWIPLDATLGRGGIGGGHLKLAHSNLEGAGPFAAFLPVFKVLGQLELEVVEQE